MRMGHLQDDSSNRFYKNSNNSISKYLYILPKFYFLELLPDSLPHPSIENMKTAALVLIIIFTILAITFIAAAIFFISKSIASAKSMSNSDTEEAVSHGRY